MRKISIIMPVLGMCLLAAVATAQTKSQGSLKPGAGAYNPSAIYNGAYVTDFVYYRNPGAIIWIRAAKLDRLRYISCEDALNHLNRKGAWKGHLNPDGSCGPTSEPSDWSLGNWLNYEDSLPGTDQ